MYLVEPATPERDSGGLACVHLVYVVRQIQAVLERIDQRLDLLPSELPDHAPLQPSDDAPDVRQRRALRVGADECVTVFDMPGRPCLALTHPGQHAIRAVAALVLRPVLERLVPALVPARAPDLRVLLFEGGDVGVGWNLVGAVFEAGLLWIEGAGAARTAEPQRQARLCRAARRAHHRQHPAAPTDRSGLRLRLRGRRAAADRGVVEPLVGGSSSSISTQQHPCGHPIQAATACLLERVNTAEVMPHAQGRVEASSDLRQPRIEQTRQAHQPIPIHAALFARRGVVGCRQPDARGWHSKGRQHGLTRQGALLAELQVAGRERWELDLRPARQHHRRAGFLDDPAVCLCDLLTSVSVPHVALVGGAEHGAGASLAGGLGGEAGCVQVGVQVGLERTDQTFTQQPLRALLPGRQPPLDDRSGAVAGGLPAAVLVLVALRPAERPRDHAHALTVQQRQARRAARTDLEGVGVAAEQELRHQRRLPFLAGLPGRRAIQQGAQGGILDDLCLIPHAAHDPQRQAGQVGADRIEAGPHPGELGKGRHACMDVVALRHRLSDLRALTRGRGRFIDQPHRPQDRAPPAHTQQIDAPPAFWRW